MSDVRRYRVGAADGPTVSVRGEAAIRTGPDEALVWITLAAIEPAPGPALADVARRSQVLVAMLDELGITREDQSTTGITVQEEFDHTKDGRRSWGHRAAASVSIQWPSWRNDIALASNARRVTLRMPTPTLRPTWWSSTAKTGFQGSSRARCQLPAGVLAGALRALRNRAGCPSRRDISCVSWPRLSSCCDRHTALSTLATSRLRSS